MSLQILQYKIKLLLDYPNKVFPFSQVEFFLNKKYVDNLVCPFKLRDPKFVCLKKAI